MRIPSARITTQSDLENIQITGQISDINIITDRPIIAQVELEVSLTVCLSSVRRA